MIYWSSSHTLLDNANGRPSDNKIVNLFVSVCLSTNAVQQSPIYPVESFDHVEIWKRTPPGYGVHLEYGTYAL